MTVKTRWNAPVDRGSRPEDTVVPECGRLLDTEAAAAYLNETPRWVRRMWAARKLPGYKLGRSVRFSCRDLDKYLAANHVEAIR